MTTKEKLDVYEIITKTFIDALEEGVVPWQKPWVGGAAGAPKSYISKKDYRGCNVWILAATAAVKAYKSMYWLTYKQCSDKKGQVRKGENGTIISFWSPTYKKDESGEKVKSGFMLRYYRVFNTDQCDGLKSIEDTKAEDENILDFNPIEQCELILEKYTDKPSIRHSGGRACYWPGDDNINLPEKENFKSVEEYYSTLFHELVHSTGHEKRLDRDLKNWFGSDPYAQEELVAEMGATYLNAMAGVVTSTIDNSKAYIQSWIAKLKNDKRFIITAASRAQKACDYMLGKKWGDANDQTQSDTGE